MEFQAEILEEAAIRVDRKARSIVVASTMRGALLGAALGAGLAIGLSWLAAGKKTGLERVPPAAAAAMAAFILGSVGAIVGRSVGRERAFWFSAGTQLLLAVLRIERASTGLESAAANDLAASFQRRHPT